MVLVLLVFNVAPLKAQDFDIVYEVADVISDLLQVAPNRPLYKNREKKLSMAKDIVEVARHWELPELLFTVKLYNESSFLMSAVSKDGYETKGLGQMHGASVVGCNMKTRKGQLNCSARWLRKCYDKCKTWKGALIAYGTSGYCKAKKARFPKKYAYSVDRQIKMWMEFEEQRQHVRDEMIDDMEHYAAIKEQGALD